jgi:sorbitol-specific phosphotransferase system component IIC
MALIGIALAIPTLIGLGAVIVLMGERLGKVRLPFLTYLRGGGLLLLACITPFIGWFVFTPLVIWASLGSVIAILVKPKKGPIAAEVTDIEADKLPIPPKE